MLMEHFMKKPAVVRHLDCGRVGFDFMDDGSVYYLLDGRSIHGFHSEAAAADGRSIDTRSAKRSSVLMSEEAGNRIIEASYIKEGLELKQVITVRQNENVFEIYVELSDRKNQVETNYLAPLDFIYPSNICAPLFMSLDQKMLLVPYDNDMWVRYESAPLRPGRTSYDVTAVYDEKTLRGLIIGALDFDCWKNAIRCSAFDARCYKAFSGVADACTHDCLPHGTIIGKKVRSSRFVCGWYDDIRNGLEEYGKRAMEGKFAFRWAHGVPFGWNSFSALSIGTTVEHWKQAADYIYNELPNFRGGEDTTFINLDATFGLGSKKLAAVIAECHARGQKVGTYMAPLTMIKGLDLLPLRGSFGKSRKNTVMRMPDGTPYHAIDGSTPVDITRPEVELDLRLSLRDIADRGYDYLKIDFLSHGAVEGKRFDPAVRTGRQALMRFYKILSEELDPKKIGRDIFVSLSIAPLFPGGYGHARRCCCDAFGHHEDVRYVLNALNFGWWTSGSVYCFADPDHTVLYNSVVDGRGPADENSARSRYNASVISGTVMLLSDNFGPAGDAGLIENSKLRAKKFADNTELNAVARLGIPFRPAFLTDGTTNVYYLNHDGRFYVALFNFDSERRSVGIDCSIISAPERGIARSLNSGESFAYEHSIEVDLDAYDSVILELNPKVN